MATFKICVFRHQKKKDGKYPVLIRVYWRKKQSYIKTEFYAHISQISQKKGTFELNDITILNKLHERILTFEHFKAKLDNINSYTSKQLANYFVSEIEKNENDIDFLVFGLNYCIQRKFEKKSYERISTTLRNLHDFCNDSLPIRELTSKKLTEFEKYLRTERTITRINQHGNPVTTTRPPCSDHCIADYMSDIRTVFNAALLEFNDDENNRITHYPFRRYKPPQVPETAKRNITPKEIMKIVKLKTDIKRAAIARDVFLLSFYLVGMNTADIYALQPSNYLKGRITYNRQKTRGKRKDNALISIKVESEAKEIINRYIDPTKKKLLIFHNLYSSFRDFNRNINIGLKTVATLCKIDAQLSTYYARHSWATIARNDCKVAKSDVSECLNHSDQTTKITDIYIKKDWTVIDEVNRKVINHVFSCENRNKSVLN